MKASPEQLAFGLNEIALTLRYWLDWNRKERDNEPNLTTDDSTSVIVVPPHWPYRGGLTLWAETLDAARDALRASAQEGQDPELRRTLQWISEQRWNEDADLDDICTRADRALNTTTVQQPMNNRWRELAVQLAKQHEPYVPMFPSDEVRRRSVSGALLDEIYKRDVEETALYTTVLGKSDGK